MPIRFRCNCGQLLGIARRKAGAMVRCPSCHNEVAVPQPDEAGTALPSAPEPLAEPAAEPAAPALFERDDFDALLQGGMSMGPSRSRGGAVRTPVPPPRPQPLPPSVPVVQLEAKPWAPAAAAPASGPGLVLSPARATVLTVVVILLLALAFASGLIVGRFVL